MCLEWLKNKLCPMWDKYSQIPPPKDLEPIDFSEILTMLRAEYPYCAIYLSDNNYKTTSIEEIQRFLRDDITNNWQYVSEYMDCDDFSYALMGRLSNPDWGSLPFGILWVIIEDSSNVTGHALNLFIDKNRNIVLIEPQTDEIFVMPDNWKPYLLMM